MQVKGNPPALGKGSCSRHVVMVAMRCQYSHGTKGPGLDLTGHPIRLVARIDDERVPGGSLDDPAVLGPAASPQGEEPGLLQAPPRWITCPVIDIPGAATIESRA